MTQTVAVVGLGYVGLPLALLVSKKGYGVIGIDVDASKVEQINARRAPFTDAAIETELQTTKLNAYTEFSQLAQADIIIVCVPTPIDGESLPDLSILQAACRQITKHLSKGRLLIIESTINPGVCDEIVLPILEADGKRCGRDFYLAHCPERINPGDPDWDVSNIPRVVGGYDKISLYEAVNFYQSILDAPVKPMDSLKEAEAVKVVENSFRDINIAFVNELAMSFAKLGIDVVNVIDGAATKPFSFMPHYPGAGVGGHCIPVDPYYLIEYAKQQGFNHTFLRTARRVNKAMPSFVVEQLLESIDQAKLLPAKTRVAVLGLSYKPDVGDLRESPSLEIIKLLGEEGLEVVTYDPYIASTTGSLDEALKKSQAVIVATAHQEFLDLKPKALDKTAIQIVIDGRNCLDKPSFQGSQLIYHGIGR